MKIALYNLTTTTRYGGVESFVWDLSRQLVQRGHSITIIGGVGPVRETIPGVRVLTFPFISRRFWQAFPLLRRAYAEAKLLERLTMAIAALPELVRGGYDIIHIQKPYDMLPALFARRLSGARALLGCHGEDFYAGDWLLACQMDGAVSCSAFNARTVAARYSVQPTVIYNGIDNTLFQRVAPDTALRKELATEHLLLYAGRLQTWKGVETAIRALPHLPTATLLIAGDGEDRARLEQLAHDTDVRGRVRFLGAVPRTALPRLYSTADLLLATSYASETFGISLVEAQACGLPVVASNFGGFPEVVDDGCTGLLVPPRDPDALAVAVASLLHDPTRRAAMAAAAPAWAAQYFWPAVTDRVEAAYCTVLNGQSARVDRPSSQGFRV
ncbi:MAG: glycosyltransferase family 4 protein [Chloroflexaceae bacterium]|nr:glycosyltransferase family 4 protein [Chloroflexaceae bacterium]